MQRKPEEQENHERWLVSYADFITLLFAFFVVLYAISQVDMDKLKKLAGSLSSSFESPGGDPRPGGGAGPNLDAHSDGGSMRPSPVQSGPEEAVETSEDATALRKILDEARCFVRENALEDSLRLEMAGSELLVGLRDTRLFQPGSNELSAPGVEMLLRVGALIARSTHPLRFRALASPSAAGSVRTTPFDLAAQRLETVAGFLASRLGLSPFRFSLLVYGDYGGISGPATCSRREAFPPPERGWIELVVGDSRLEGELTVPVEPAR